LSFAANGREKQDIQIAITFDDLPVHNDLPPDVTRRQVGRNIIKALKDAHVSKVYGFVNASHVEKEPALGAVFADWHAAGFLLGNHTWAHSNLNELSAESYIEEIDRNEGALKEYSNGKDWHWFRYPFLVEGDQSEKRKIVRDALAKNGYHIAAITMSFGDYMWNAPYARCMTKQDMESVKLLERSYLKAAADAMDHSHLMSTVLYKRDIPYVLLMHVGAFDAHMLPKLLALYKSKGVKFITLEQAQKDPYYASDMNPFLPAEPPSLERRMWARKLTVPGSEPSLPAMLDSICSK
jgi:peptidoglycan/xylan/chitin deacetylase (PgdA/CDA1 family)